MDEKLNVKYPLKYRVGGWVGLCACALSLFIAWSKGEWLVGFVFLSFGLVCFYSAVVGSSTLELSANSITQQHLFGRYGITWDEVETIQLCISGDWLMAYESIIFEGSGKRLNVVGPRDWVGGQEAEARRLFFLETSRRKLRIKENPMGIFKFSKNVRLAKD